MSFQIRGESHPIHIIAKKGSVAFLALTAPCENWAMLKTASKVPEYLQPRMKNREKRKQKRKEKKQKRKGKRKKENRIKSAVQHIKLPNATIKWRSNTFSSYLIHFLFYALK